tara:strand:+ start:1037 stop:4837 length:3801 start_codon:yes stop_codon:yes gene_type:complete
MIKKITLIMVFTFLFATNLHSKAPPLGTGSLVPTNIMIMLDNSGSMAWDLGGNQLTSGSFLNNPTDINVDSQGNIYVWSPNNTNYEGKNYKLHVFNPDGSIKKRLITYNGNGNAYFNPICGTSYGSNPKFDIHNDQIYYLDTGYRTAIHVTDLDGNCIRTTVVEHEQYGSYRVPWMTIEVTDNYIYLGTGSCSFFCYTDTRSYRVGQKGAGAIKILRRSNFSDVTTIGAQGSYYSHNIWGDQSDISISPDGTKIAVVSKGASSVCVHDLNNSGDSISFGCTQVGGKPNGRPNQNYDRSWWKAWDFRGSYPDYHYDPFGVAFDSSNNVYVVDGPKHMIKKFNSSGTYLSNYGSRNCTGGDFCHPNGLYIDSNDKIWVADKSNNLVKQIAFNASNVGSKTSTLTSMPVSRMDIARKVIKRIVSNTELTSSANFGLMEWGHPYRYIRWPYDYRYDTWRYNWYGTRIRVPIDKDGARKIFTDVDNVFAGGGTYLAPALNIARSYFANGHSGFPSPRIPGAKCQANYIIVISDGVWASHGSVRSTARDLKNQYEIKTFSVGFAVGNASSSTKQRYVDLAVDGGTVSPLYADNEAEMIAKLTDAIKQVVSGSLSFNSPAVMSDKQRGNFIYQSTFKYAKNTQWEGHLKKHKFNSSSGQIEDTVWDAADVLNKKDSSKRNLWTIGLGVSGLNNFTTSNRGQLKSILFPDNRYPTSQAAPTNDQVDTLINFIRGDDVFDEDGDSNTSETRHKLADIYHANVNVVGPVEGISNANDGTANFDKKNNYYRSQKNYDLFKNGNSCGETCNNRTEVVLAGSNGGILHAFDASDGDELWGYIPPNIIGKLKTMITSKANASNPIYGIDGSATIKDIYFDDTADNVNNPRWRTVLISALGPGGHGYFALDVTNIKQPKHLFAIENDTFNNVVKVWNSLEQKREFPYTAGTPISNAAFDYSQLGEAWSTPRIIRIKVDGKDKWVAVIGGGFNGATNPSYGSCIFIIDLESEGEILKKIYIEDTTKSNIVNSVPSDLAVITADGTEKANYNGAMIYAADLEGKITKLNLTDKGTLYQTTTIFNAQSTNENGRYIYDKPEATIKNSNLWLYFGTGDKQKLQTLDNSKIKNRLYGIKDMKFPNFEAVNPPGDVSKCKTGKNNCPSTNDLGWFIDLDKSKKVTASPTVDSNVVYFPVYEPRPLSNVCDNGDAILFKANTTCGTATQRKLGKGVLSKVIIQDDNLIVGISGEAEKDINSKENVISLKSDQKSSGNLINEESWKENF